MQCIFIWSLKLFFFLQFWHNITQQSEETIKKRKCCQYSWKWGRTEKRCTQPRHAYCFHTVTYWTEWSNRFGMTLNVRDPLRGWAIRIDMSGGEGVVRGVSERLIVCGWWNYSSWLYNIHPTISALFMSPWNGFFCHLVLLAAFLYFKVLSHLTLCFYMLLELLNI